jgi:tRNA G18 (ribose-2'-O)-methylase SpoU
MSHSRKKTPIFGIASGSEKKDKRAANRIFRKRTKTKISMGQFERLPLYVREIIDVWSMNKDGKCYWVGGLTDEGGKAMRK